MLSQKYFQAFTNSVRQTALQMVTQAQSGHPGGSFSSIDFLSVLYLEKIAQNHSPIIVSNGHISPAIYAILAELGVFSKKLVVEEFRKDESIFEGHVSIDVPGVFYSTGPLGVGVSAAAGVAKAFKLQNDNRPVYAVMGDGESQEGQVYEMAHFAAKYNLDNLIVIVDDNKVQLTDSIAKTMPIDLRQNFQAFGWSVLECDGHNPTQILDALNRAESQQSKPTIILCQTIMGKGAEFMELEGQQHKATWHGKAPSNELMVKALTELQNTKEQITDLKQGLKKLNFKAVKYKKQKDLAKIPGVKVPKSIEYTSDTLTDCRSAYGAALKDLGLNNPNIVAVTADLSGSVKTNQLQSVLPSHHIECGIAEQNMVSVSGGLSKSGIIPFCSTFGVFMTSRAKDQARVNDINHTNVKMVATHCGLSVGEDGPTHQALDDVNSFLGHPNTHIIEPADPNQCDKIIRFIASHYGNFYVRMGRHKFPVITDKYGDPAFGKSYKFQYGLSDKLQKGDKLTLVAVGACVHESQKAIHKLNNFTDIDFFALSSLNHIDNKILKSIQKTSKLILVADQFVDTGVFSVMSNSLVHKSLAPKKLCYLGVKRYHRSATQKYLYKQARIDSDAIYKQIKKFI